jgi:hypothetical protein
MRAIARTLGAVMVLAALGAATHADDPSCGTIDTAGAVIEVGAAPTQGQLVQDPCVREEERPVIPELPALGAIGTFTAAPGTFAPLPAGAPSSPEDFHPSSSQGLPAGDHVFADLIVDAGITVGVADGAEIWTTGDVIVRGTLRFSGAGNLHCGGDLVVEGSEAPTFNEAYIQTTTLGGPVNIQVGGNLSVLTNGRVFASRGGMQLETFGPPPSSGIVTIVGIVWVGEDELTVKASGDIDIRADYIETDYGSASLRSFGGDIELDEFGWIEVAGSTIDPTDPAVIEAAGAVRFFGGSGISAPTLQVSALGGDVVVRDSRIDAASRFGPSWVRASGAVVVEGDARFEMGSGHESVEVSAFAGSVELRETSGNRPRYALDGSSVRLSARDDINLRGDGEIDVRSGAAEVHAHAGAVRFEDELELRTRAGSTGGIHLQGHDRVDLPLGSAGTLRVEGLGDLQLIAGAGGATASARDLDAFQGGVRVLSEGPITLDTDAEAGGDIRIVSTRSRVDAPHCTLTTENRSDGSASGSIAVESWAGSAGRVDVSDSTLRTGTSTTRSGDVTLRVVQAGGAEELDSYLLPKVVKTKRGKKDVADSLMTISGDLDLGTTGPDLTAATTLRIGDRTFDLPGLTANKKGNKLTYRDDVLDMKVTTDKNGSSKGKFTFKLRGDPSDVGDPDGTLVLGLACSEMDARCAVALAGGGFKRGKVRGAVVDPPVRLDKAKVVVKGAGKDKLSLKLGLTSGGAPGTAPEVEIGIGDTWSVVLPGEDFQAKKETFRFKGDESGIRKVTLDYGKEAVSVSGKGLDLGPHVDQDGVLRLRLRVGAEEFALRVRMRTKGATHSY